jgi:tRNA threonylcarbamoyl adenosine modification protein YjeE
MIVVELPDEAATAALAARIARLARPGDVIALKGELGAGKTSFARAFIRARGGAEAVPSPTFTLVQTYALPRFTVVHADLYRVTHAGELAELGVDEAAENAVVLLEWPDRAAEVLPADRLDIAFTLAPNLGPNQRNAEITGHGAFAPRIERLAAIRHFLIQEEMAAEPRTHVQGDASTRAYERLSHKEQKYILMNAPRRPDGPPVRGGLPYSAIAHLADDVKPFVAMARALRERGLSAPQIHAADLNEGLILLEDLGTEGVVEGDPPAPIEERYSAAVDVLIALHREPVAATLTVAPGVEYRVPPYDIEAFLIEAELLLDWYIPHRDRFVTAAARSDFTALWRGALSHAYDQPATWVLRDYHSPNLLWLPEREGLARVGILDFQDALMGPAPYDLVSLLQDARVDVPEALEARLLEHYLLQAAKADPAFDAEAFKFAYAALGAQRNTKILGIFVRLSRRDGKAQYLAHLPRIWRYVERNLRNPRLASLAAWYDRYFPAAARTGALPT